MAKSKTMMWLSIVAGVLWILAGMRDLFAPGFFSISGRTASGSSVALNFAIGIMFLVVAVSSQAARSHSLKNKS